MAININLEYWLSEAEQPVAMQAPGSNPMTPPMMSGDGMQQTQPPPGVQQQQTSQPVEEDDDDVSNDPQEIEDFEQKKEQSFEKWRHEFFHLSTKGDVNEMLESIGQIRDRQLESSQRRFVEDNLAITLYRQDANIAKASQEIRSLIDKDLDRANPAVSLMQHITLTLEKMQILQENFVKLSGLYGKKGEVHRQFVCALLGGVETPSADREEVIYVGKDYTINISTRMNSDFGEINLGRWELKSDDPEKYLSESELKRLSGGAPEEKQVLRRRVIIESISAKFKQRAFLIHVVTPDGTVHALGWDLGNSLKAAYKEGKVIVRGRESEVHNAQIDDDGHIVGLIDVDIMYVRETGEINSFGHPESEEISFLEHRNSNLYVKADANLLRVCADSMSGLFYRSMPWNGNPSDIQVLSRCVPSITEILGKRCYGG